MRKSFGTQGQVLTKLKSLISRLGYLAQSGASLTANQGVAGSNFRPATYFCGDLSWINFTVILPLLLIQEGQMSVSGKSMCTKYWLTAYKG